MLSKIKARIHEQTKARGLPEPAIIKLLCMVDGMVAALTEELYQVAVSALPAHMQSPEDHADTHAVLRACAHMQAVGQVAVAQADSDTEAATRVHDALSRVLGV